MFSFIALVLIILVDVSSLLVEQDFWCEKHLLKGIVCPCVCPSICHTSFTICKMEKKPLRKSTHSLSARDFYIFVRWIVFEFLGHSLSTSNFYIFRHRLRRRYVNSCTHTHTHTHIRIHTHTDINSRTHTYTHTHTHIHTHAHTLTECMCPFPGKGIVLVAVSNQKLCQKLCIIANVPVPNIWKWFFTLADSIYCTFLGHSAGAPKSLISSRRTSTTHFGCERICLWSYL